MYSLYHIYWKQNTAYRRSRNSLASIPFFCFPQQQNNLKKTIVFFSKTHSRIAWKHRDMDTFPYWPPVDSPHKEAVMWNFRMFLYCYPNEVLSKLLSCRWFESSWRACDVSVCDQVMHRFAPSQWETALLCNDVSHWLGTSLETTLNTCFVH